MTAIPKPKRERDDAYGDFIRSHDCCLPTDVFPHVCTHSHIEAHHVPKAGLKGMGTKVSDYRQVPVCFNGHRYCERNPQAVAAYLELKIKDLRQRYTPPLKKRERKTTAKQSKKLIRAWCVSKGNGRIALPVLEDLKEIEEYREKEGKVKFIRCWVEAEGRWRQ